MWMDGIKGGETKYEWTKGKRVKRGIESMKKSKGWMEEREKIKGGIE